MERIRRTRGNSWLRHNIQEALLESLDFDKCNTRLRNGLYLVFRNAWVYDDTSKKSVEPIKLVEILAKPEEELLRYKNFGRQCLEQTKYLAAARGIPLEEEIYQNPKDSLMVGSGIMVNELREGQKRFERFSRYLRFKLAVEQYRRFKDVLSENKSFLDYLRFFAPEVITLEMTENRKKEN